MKKKLLVLCGSPVILAASLVLLGAWISQPGELPAQPIAFNHRLHLEQGLACQDCHRFVATQTFAGLPSKHICFGCHDPELEKGKPQFVSLMAFARADGDIPWSRVTATNEDVFFSHRRHVSVAGMDCRDCHADMPERTRPPTRGPVRMKMKTCIHCHEQRQASTDCIACHR